MSSQNQSKSDNNFILQGSILATASIISRVIGLLYRIPLTAIIGKTGNDYYGTAYEVYNILLIISSYSIPLAVSKLVSAKMAKKQAKNAIRILIGSLIFAFITGGGAGLLVYFGADYFTGDLLKTPLSAIALRVLAPTLLIVAILGVLRGFFQGLHTMVPSAMSQIAEQIVNAIVSIAAAYMLYNYGLKAGGLLGNADNYAAAYGAAGGTLGTTSGAATALIFMLLILIIYIPRHKEKMKSDRTKVTESYLDIFKILILTIIPVLLSTTLYNISSIIDQGIFKNIVNIQGYTSKQISEWWGVFTGQYKVLINVPISIASALAASSVPSLSASFAEGNSKKVRRQIQSVTRFIMVIAFPCAVGMAVLAKPVMMMLFQDSDKTSSLMLQVGAVSIVFYSLSTLSNGLLQGVDKMKEPVKNAIIALVLHIIVLILLLLVFNLNIYAVIIANAVYALLMCILNQMSLNKHCKVYYNTRTTFILPAISALIMGLVVFGVYNLFYNILHSNMISVVISILVGIIEYFVSMLLLHGISEEDILRLPKGRLLVNLAKKVHLL